MSAEESLKTGDHVVDKSHAPSVWIKYLGQTSNVFQLSSVTTAPGLFTQNASGSGPGAILNQDNSLNGPGNRAAKGSIVQVYLTG